MLKKILQRILDGIDTSVAFGKEHLPDVLQQLLTWHFGALTALIGFVTTLDHMIWLKIWLAPKLYLLKYGAQLIK